MSAETVFIQSKRAGYSVSLTHPGHTLEPITLRVSSGAASTQDYLTPEQARILAAQLVCAAREVEEQS